MGGALWGGVWSGIVRLGKVVRGIAWLREALYRVVKFCPVKHCYARYAKALSGEVRFCVVGRAGHCTLL